MNNMLSAYLLKCYYLEYIWW